jgi:hypothetical protein
MLEKKVVMCKKTQREKKEFFSYACAVLSSCFFLFLVAIGRSVGWSVGGSSSFLTTTEKREDSPATIVDANFDI